MDPRTIRNFDISGDTRPIVDAWAAENGFRLLEGTSASRQFQKCYGFWTAPIRLGISQEGSKVQLEAWVPINFFVRLMALFTLPKQMSVDSGGFRGALPRKMGRQAVNKLLEKLAQPPIV
jgi:hypothetical protein